MSTLEKPFRNAAPAEREADRLVESFKRSSRDHSATLTDDNMCRALADNWTAFDQALQQIQRDISRPVGDSQANQNLNSVFVAFSQIHSRILEFVDRGMELNKQ